MSPTTATEMTIDELLTERAEALSLLGDLYSRFGPEGPYDDRAEMAQEAVEVAEAELDSRGVKF